MVKTPDPAPEFRRRIVLEIGAEDYALLIAAQRQYGTMRAALVAGLRALDEEGMTKAPVSG